MPEIYFDNGATTRVFPEVREIMTEVLDIEYGNPSSIAFEGVSRGTVCEQGEGGYRPESEGGAEGDLFYIRRYGGEQSGAHRDSHGAQEDGKTYHHVLY